MIIYPLIIIYLVEDLESLTREPSRRSVFNSMGNLPSPWEEMKMALPWLATWVDLHLFNHSKGLQLMELVIIAGVVSRPLGYLSPRGLFLLHYSFLVKLYAMDINGLTSNLVLGLVIQNWNALLNHAWKFLLRLVHFCECQYLYT